QFGLPASRFEKSHGGHGAGLLSPHWSMQFLILRSGGLGHCMVFQHAGLVASGGVGQMSLHAGSFGSGGSGQTFAAAGLLASNFFGSHGTGASGTVGRCGGSGIWIDEMLKTSTCLSSTKSAVSVYLPASPRFDA